MIFLIKRCYEIAKQGIADKHKRAELFSAIKEDFKASMSEEDAAEFGFLVGQYFKAAQKEAVRSSVR